MAHSWIPVNNRLGLQPIEDTSTTQNHELGAIVAARHATYGAAEFIYLKGVASTVAGALVSFDPVAGTTTLSPNTGVSLGNPCAVAMSANIDSQYGWYAIEGAVPVKKPAVKAQPASLIYLSTTAGRVRTSAYSGRNVIGAKSVNTTTITTTTSTVNVLLQRPSFQGKQLSV